MKNINIFIRDVDPAVKAKLEAIAKQKGLSLNSLVKIILSDYAIMPDIRYLNDKYESLFKDMTAMYNHMLEKTGEAISENTDTIQRLLELINS